jgi:MFS family permease
MLWLVCCFNYADRQSIYSVFPKLKQEFGFDTAQLGLIGSAFMWVYAGGAPLAGWICDRVRRKDLILGGCIFWSFVTVMTGWCHKFWHFVTVRALEGFGETFYFPASVSLTSDYHSPRTRSRALSWHQSSVYAGTILGGWLGAWFAENHGWRIGFYFFGGTGIVLAIVLYRFLREPARGESEGGKAPSSKLQTPSAVVKSTMADEEKHQGPSSKDSLLSPTLSSERAEGSLPLAQTLRVIFRTPVVPLLMLAFLCANFVATIFLTWTPTFLVDKFHFKLTHAGLSGAVFIHLASALSVPIAGWLADKLARRVAGGRMWVQAAGLIVGFAFVMLVGKTADVKVLLVSMTLFGFCKGFYDSGIFASLFDVIEPRARGTAAGLMNTVGWGGGALGPLFVGLATKYGHGATGVENMSNAIAVAGVAYVVGAVLIGIAILLIRKQKIPPSAAVVVV